MTIQRMCEVGQVSRATFYRFDPDREPADEDLDLRDEIQRVALEFPCYGRPRITAELKRRGWDAGHRRVGRIIVRDEFRPAIPRRVARQHCPSPLHRHHQPKTIAASKEMIYHRTVNSLLTVCLTHRANLNRSRSLSEYSPTSRVQTKQNRYIMFYAKGLPNLPS